jgi:hypothetical protein
MPMPACALIAIEAASKAITNEALFMVLSPG